MEHLFLVTWVSRGAIQPGADDFSMLWLLFRTFLPQVGGLVLMLAQAAVRLTRDGRLSTCYEGNHSLGGGLLMKTVATCAAMLALGVMMAGAQDDDINSASFMLPHCRALVARESSNFVFQGVCVGTIDSLQYVRPLMGCADIPNGVTADQALNVVIRYIEARPERMHELFKALAIEAMFNAWPCRP